jgi:hypothetical protein
MRRFTIAGNLLFLVLLVTENLTGEESKPAVTTRPDPAGELLREWFAEGKASGNAGDCYDNRDGGHSPLDLIRYPQLRPLTYLQSQRDQKKDYGPAAEVRPETVIGNASLAGPAVGGASIPRLLFSTSGGMNFLNSQYHANQLYVYPEHQDHDPAGEVGAGYGDLYPVNSPCLLIAQGSSGSDQPLLEAVVMTLASFQPAVKEQLRRQKLLMPVVQQILRSSLKTVKERDDYLTAVAHPSAFAAETIDEEKMMRLAQGMSLETLPPIFHLELVRESPAARPGIDFFESPERKSESLADQGAVIARVFRGTAREREITVRAARVHEWAGRSVRIHWRVLRGDAESVTITRSETAPEATIRVKWTEPGWPVEGSPGLTSRRIEVGVFADNGETYSPPCFVTFYFLPNEKRRYDDRDRILSVDYDSSDTFTDVTLTTAKAWRDLYHYDERSGAPTGWTREEREKPSVEFDAEGRRLQEGEPVPMRYEIDTVKQRLRSVEE